MMFNFSAGAWSLDGCDFWTLLSSGSRCGGRFFFFCDLSMYGHEHLSTWARFPGTIEMTLNKEKNCGWLQLWFWKSLLWDFCLTAIGYEDA